MRLGNLTCPQPPLRMGTYQFLREVGLLHGKGPNLHESFGLGINHSIEVFQDRWKKALEDWLKLVMSARAPEGPDVMATFHQMYEVDMYEDQDAEEDTGGKQLIDLPGGEDRRGEVSAESQARWNQSWKEGYSSRRQRALDLSEWEAASDEMSAGGMNSWVNTATTLDLGENEEMINPMSVGDSDNVEAGSSIMDTFRVERNSDQDARVESFYEETVRQMLRETNLMQRVEGMVSVEEVKDRGELEEEKMRQVEEGSPRGEVQFQEEEGEGQVEAGRVTGTTSTSDFEIHEVGEAGEKMDTHE